LTSFFLCPKISTTKREGKMKRVAAVVLVAGFLFAISYAQEKKAEFKYVGVKKCKTCHKSKKRGDQFGKWKESKHSKAYEVLASDEAKKIAKGKGIEDPQKSEECLVCHVTAYGVPSEKKMETLTLEEGVSCEACHGPGSVYKSFKTMKKLYAGEIEPQSVGLVVPDKNVCVKCHNEKSPTYKEFDFEKYYSQIAHPVPKE